MKLEDIFLKLPGLADFLTTIAQRPAGNFLLTGIQPVVKAFLLVNISRNLKKPLLVVEDNLNHAQDLYDQLSLLTASNKVNLFPVEETAAAQAAISSPQFRSQRINTLAQLKEAAITITTESGMLLPLLEPAEWRKNSFQITVGDDLKENDLAEKLTALGYLRQQMVIKPGDFSIRGSIIDIFPLTDENPVRIDLFDTQVDSLRRFSINDQRSIENIEQCTIYPATEYPLDQKLQRATLERLTALYQKATSRITDKKLKTKVEETFTELRTSLSDQQFPIKAAGFREQLLPKTCLLKDYFEPNSLVVWDDFTRIKEVDRLRLQEEAAWQTGQLALGKQFVALPSQPDINDLLKKR